MVGWILRPVRLFWPRLVVVVVVAVVGKKPQSLIVGGRNGALYESEPEAEGRTDERKDEAPGNGTERFLLRTPKGWA